MSTEPINVILPLVSVLIGALIPEIRPFLMEDRRYKRKKKDENLKNLKSTYYDLVGVIIELPEKLPIEILKEAGINIPNNNINWYDCRKILAEEHKEIYFSLPDDDTNGEDLINYCEATLLVMKNKYDNSKKVYSEFKKNYRKYYELEASDKVRKKFNRLYKTVFEAYDKSIYTKPKTEDKAKGALLTSFSLEDSKNDLINLIRSELKEK